ncbi:hypothetical protein D0T90_03070 [Neisseria animalis]|uniref:Uncharacterized protein n=1 Tax=Neisseria animalis TaxID=492 RepID=A0A5P3MRA4_NEIAN|nr:hypothetical protein D0T90_03070 [Neisseria animalis]ROW32749.1 hypothetical protein CGZ60_02685 [Neisseria animalis]
MLILYGLLHTAWFHAVALVWQYKHGANGLAEMLSARRRLYSAVWLQAAGCWCAQVFCLFCRDKGRLKNLMRNHIFQTACKVMLQPD